MLKLIRRALSGRTDDFTFYRYNASDQLAIRESAGLYIHIPFCRNSCPYCPYVKVGYKEDLARAYKEALKKEISHYHKLFGAYEFSSLYIGGGTPTLMSGEIGEILDSLRKCFTIKGDIALETSPDEINPALLQDLKSIGVNMISLGVQSFQDACLHKIGRKYDGRKAESALAEVASAGFDSVNVDLIFGIRDQSIDDICKDLATVIGHSIPQVTCYPLFTFPFTEIGKYRKIRHIELPDHRTRRKMYYALNGFLKERGFGRTNVWSFSIDHGHNYSSVTRDHFLGLGAGSGSYNGRTFYFNTFSVPDYIRAAHHGLPVSIKMDVSSRLEKLIWLYWQLYSTTVDKNKYHGMFKDDIQKEFGTVLKFIRMAGFVEYEDEYTIRLTTRGSHWIHLIQNYFALNYVSKIWTEAKREAWPGRIKI